MSLCDHKLSKNISQPGGNIQENISKTEGVPTFLNSQIKMFSNILVCEE